MNKGAKLLCKGQKINKALYRNKHKRNNEKAGKLLLNFDKGPSDQYKVLMLTGANMVISNN